MDNVKRIAQCVEDRGVSGYRIPAREVLMTDAVVILRHPERNILL